MFKRVSLTVRKYQPPSTLQRHKKAHSTYSSACRMPGGPGVPVRSSSCCACDCHVANANTSQRQVAVLDAFKSIIRSLCHASRGFESERPGFLNASQASSVSTTARIFVIIIRPKLFLAHLRYFLES